MRNDARVKSRNIHRAINRVMVERMRRIDTLCAYAFDDTFLMQLNSYEPHTFLPLAFCFFFIDFTHLSSRSTHINAIFTFIYRPFWHIFSLTIYLFIYRHNGLHCDNMRDVIPNNSLQKR